MEQKLLCYEWLKSNYSIFIYKVRGVFSLRLSFKGTDLLKRIVVSLRQIEEINSKTLRLRILS